MTTQRQNTQESMMTPTIYYSVLELEIVRVNLQHMADDTLESYHVFQDDLGVSSFAVLGSLEEEIDGCSLPVVLEENGVFLADLVPSAMAKWTPHTVHTLWRITWTKTPDNWTGPGDWDSEVEYLGKTDLSHLAEPECTWEQDDNGAWETDCGKAFVFETGGPSANKMCFCCFCGRQLVQADHTQE